MAQNSTHRKRDHIIDESIRRVYDETLEEGVPDRFRNLLEALKKQEQDRRSGQ